MVSLTEQDEFLDNTLKNLIQSLGEVKGAMIITAKGIVAQSFLKVDDDERWKVEPDAEIGLLVSTLGNVALNFVRRKTNGDLEQVFIRHTHGYVIIMAAGPKAILTIFTAKDVKLGVVFLDLKRTCEKIAPHFPPDYPDLIFRTEDDDVRDEISQLLQRYDEWQSRPGGTAKKV